MLIPAIRKIRPRNVLDVCCGCGSTTAQVADHVEHITAIDISVPLLLRCRSAAPSPNTALACMDGRQLGFTNGAFDLAYERFSLHHIADWERALDELIRVSSDWIIAVEPVDDPRSDAKRNTIAAQQLYLDVQHEAGYEHYKHIDVEALVGTFKRRCLRYEVRVEENNQPIGFDDYFADYSRFAAATGRPEHWNRCLDTFRRELGTGRLCKDDVVIITARK